MKIYVLGTRGIPDVAGGVETHCERLYPRLASMGMDVTVVRRRCYVSPRNEYRGVRLIDVYAPRIKSLEAMCHTLLGVFKAGIDRADVVHLHAVGAFAACTACPSVRNESGGHQSWSRL